MGFTFDGVHSDTHEIYVHKKNLSILADERNYLSQIIGKHGIYDFGLDFAARKIDFECSVAEDTHQSLQEKRGEIADWLNPLKGCKDLIIDYDYIFVGTFVLKKVYSARLETAGTIDELLGVGKFSLSFICPSPFARGENLEEVSFVDDVAAITRIGSAPTPCEISVTLTTSSSYLTFTHSNGEFIKITHDFVLDDTLEIDTEKRTVKINGINSLTSLDVESTFFELNEETETITATPAGVITGSVKFYERWL